MNFKEYSILRKNLCIENITFISNNSHQISLAIYCKAEEYPLCKADVKCKYTLQMQKNINAKCKMQMQKTHNKIVLPQTLTFGGRAIILAILNNYKCNMASTIIILIWYYHFEIKNKISIWHYHIKINLLKHFKKNIEKWGAMVKADALRRQSGLAGQVGKNF